MIEQKKPLLSFEQYKELRSQGLSDDQKVELADAFDIVKRYTGLDMRQDFLNSVLVSFIKYGR